LEAELQTINLEFIAQLEADLEPEDLRRLFTVFFVSDVERLTAAMRAAAQAGDGGAWRRAAHALAGAAGAVGADRLEDAVRSAMRSHEASGAIDAPNIKLLEALASDAVNSLTTILARAIRRA